MISIYFLQIIQIDRPIGSGISLIRWLSTEKIDKKILFKIGENEAASLLFFKRLKRR